MLLIACKAGDSLLQSNFSHWARETFFILLMNEIEYTLSHYTIRHREPRLEDKQNINQYSASPKSPPLPIPFFSLIPVSLHLGTFDGESFMHI